MFSYGYSTAIRWKALSFCVFTEILIVCFWFQFLLDWKNILMSLFKVFFSFTGKSLIWKSSKIWWLICTTYDASESLEPLYHGRIKCWRKDRKYGGLNEIDVIEWKGFTSTTAHSGGSLYPQFCQPWHGMFVRRYENPVEK